MNIFNIFKTEEEQYYLHFKKMFSKSVKDKITISNLKVRVMSIQKTIKILIDEMKILESELEILIEKNDNKGFKNKSEIARVLKLKLTILFKLEDEFKQDFIKGVSLKIKELIDSGITSDTFNYEKIRDLIYKDIPSDYNKCVIFSDKISGVYWTGGKHITLEKIIGF